MTFANERGFNAINAILLIPKDQFEVIRGQIQDWVNRNSSTALHIFEGESDMNRNDTTIVGGEASIGDEIVLTNSTAWKQFDVKKEGNYKIWIKGSGIFTVVIDDQKEIVNGTMNGPTFSGSFQLKEGDDSRLEVTPLQDLANITGNSSNVSEDVNGTIDSIWLVSDSNNRLDGLVDDNNYDSNVSLNRMQAVTVTTTPISNNLWSSQEYEFVLNNNSTNPLIISLAEPFNPNLKAAIYTKDGGELSKVENLIPLFYSLKSGIYIDSLDTDAKKVVIYDAAAPLQWLAVTSFISLGSYILLILSANAKLANRFKGFVCVLSRVMKQSISKKKNDNNNRDYNS
jgi:hypothetical protein